MFIWICAQWEEYHTGLMLYGNEYFGVLECNYSLAAVHLVTFVFGPDFYLDRVGDYVDLPIIRNMRESYRIAVPAALPCTQPCRQQQHTMESLHWQDKAVHEVLTACLDSQSTNNAAALTPIWFPTRLCI